MRSKRFQTLVKAREFQPGMVVSMAPPAPGWGRQQSPVNSLVVRVERAADEVQRIRKEIGREKRVGHLFDLARELLEALEAVDFEGREARLVWFEGRDRPVRFASQDEVPYVTQGKVPA